MGFSKVVGGPVSDDADDERGRAAWHFPMLFVPPAHPPVFEHVLLTDSLSAVMCVVICVLEDRVKRGDAFVAAMQLACSGDRHTLRSTVAPTPRPRGTLYAVEREYYYEQALTALRAATPGAFCNGGVPALSLREYVTHLFQQAPLNDVSPAVFLIMLLYLDRAMARQAALFLNSYNAHRLVLGALVLASKFHEEGPCITQEQFATHGGVSIATLNKIEVDLLKAMNYTCFVSEEQYHALETDVMAEALATINGSEVAETLRVEAIAGFDDAVRRQHDLVDAPRDDGPKFAKGDSFQGIEMRSHAQALWFTRFVRERRTRDWQQRRAAERLMLAAAHARALATHLFPTLSHSHKHMAPALFQSLVTFASTPQLLWQTALSPLHVRFPQHHIADDFPVLHASSNPWLPDVHSPSSRSDPSILSPDEAAILDSLPNPWPGVLDSAGPFPRSSSSSPQVTPSSPPSSFNPWAQSHFGGLLVS